MLYYSLWLFLFIFFFFNDTATTEIYTLSLHDALPIFLRRVVDKLPCAIRRGGIVDLDGASVDLARHDVRSEEHTSELQSRSDLVCRLLLEKKKKLIEEFGLRMLISCKASHLSSS